MPKDILLLSTDGFHHHMSEDEIIAKYSEIDNYLRITFMDSTGYVVADSLADKLENMEIRNYSVQLDRDSHQLFLKWSKDVSYFN